MPDSPELGTGEVNGGRRVVGVTISGAEHSVNEIFSDRFVFEIPPYQRPYSWTPDEAGELFDDLLSATPPVDASDPDPYFLGSLVLAKDEQSPAAKVIDGQQRLTTLTILFAALAASFEGSAVSHMRTFIRQSGNPFAGAQDVMRLTLRPRDAEFFRTYVQESGSLEELLVSDPLHLDNDAQRNILANAKMFVARLDGLSADDRMRFATYLVSHCFLVVVSTPDRDSAYRIFAVLNDRGLDLSHADIIKSELIGEIGDPSMQDTYTSKWEDVEDELGTEAFRDLFSHIRTIYSKDKLRGSLLKEFRAEVLADVQDPREFIDDVVAPWGDTFIRIREASWESATGAEDINAWLQWLGRIDNADWVPPAILYLHMHQASAERIEDFLRRLERLAATMYIRRVGVNARIERYARLVREIEENGDVLDTGSVLDLASEECSETLSLLDGDVYNVKPRRYILLRLDNARAAAGAEYDHKVITVEHVLPQSPAPGSQWLQDFDDASRIAWTHRLANLVLLPRRKNSEAQNYDLTEKQERYFSGRNGASPFVITMEVLQAGSWTPADLERRQREVVGTLATVWDLT